MFHRRTLWIAAAISLSAWAQELPPGTLLLARVKARVRESLADLPDCTCIENVRRFDKAGPDPVLKPLDRLQFQILFSRDRELYALPGTSRWETDPSAFVNAGSIGNGVFALYLKVLFVNGQASFTYRGAGEEFQLSTPQYDFRVPVLTSGLRLSAGHASAIVAMKGSVWVDPASFDVVRIEMHADEIPAGLPFKEVHSVIDYARVRIGSSDLLLPQAANTDTLLLSGEESRNVIEFTDCKAFHAESTLRFGAQPVEAKKP